MQSSFLSNVRQVFNNCYFLWAAPLLAKAMRNPLSLEDLLPLQPEEEPKHCDSEVSRELAKLKNTERPLVRALYRAYRRPLWVIFWMCALYAFMGVLSPLILRELIAELSHAQRSASYSYGLLVLLVLNALVASLILHQVFYRVLLLMIRVRSAVTTLLYRKTLQLSNEEKQQMSAGELINMLGADIFKIGIAVNFLFSAFIYPLSFIFCLIALYWVLGWPAMLGLVVMAIFVFVSTFISSRQVKVKRALLRWSDERLSIMSEILGSIKVIKFYAWERWCAEQVRAPREKEVGTLKELAFLGSLGSFIFGSAPLFVGVATFGWFAMKEQPLEPAEIFSALSLFMVMRWCLVNVPEAINTFLEANVSVKRVEHYWARANYQALPENTLQRGALKLINASCEWNSKASALSELTLSVSPGQFVCVVGEVGSGKSALLSALLGEIRCTTGQILVGGKLGYVSQTAWILNASIKENILFGEIFEAARFDAVVKASGLTADLQSFPNGINSEIGERGINLSGGQKQRVNLARTLYQGADIYLLDDPLSALDVHVAEQVYRDAVRWFLKDATIILVTHRLEFARDADSVLVFDAGRIAEAGTPAELLARRGAFKRLVEHSNVHSPVLGSELSPHATGSESEVTQNELQIVKDEEQYEGKVASTLYLSYLTEFAPFGIAIGLFGLYTLKEAVGVSADGILTRWKELLASGVSQTSFVAWYLALSLTTGALIFLRTYYFSKRGVSAGRAYHDKLIRGVLRAPMGFFESNPIGRVLNRFSRDIDSIDSILPRTLQDCFACFYSVAVSGVVLLFVSPWAIFLLVPIYFTYWKVQAYYRPGSRDSQRFESITRSPIFAQFSESWQGLHTIRAHAKSDFLLQRMIEAQRWGMRASFSVISANRWLGARVETLGAAIIGSAAFVAVFQHGNSALGWGALGISYALTISGQMNWAVRSMSMLEGNMNSIERVEHYAAVQSERWEGAAVPQDWPSRGEVEVKNLEVRYREDLPAVLSEVSFRINPGQKVGIIGRTGSGKSTLLLSFFRMIEPSCGSISIDGVDIATLDLSQLRERLGIIPQDPVLFKGTLRRNLDPFSHYADAALTHVLYQAGLGDFFLSLPEGLESKVLEHGSNFSVGQRQLICLARALLKKSKVLFLDEPTANIDPVSDALIQRVIREHFKDSTIFTVAHRLSTIANSDRVLVMQQGRIVPSSLSQGEAQSLGNS